MSALYIFGWCRPGPNYALVGDLTALIRPQRAMDRAASSTSPSVSHLITQQRRRQDFLARASCERSTARARAHHRNSHSLRFTQWAEMCQHRRLLIELLRTTQRAARVAPLRRAMVMIVAVHGFFGQPLTGISARFRSRCKCCPARSDPGARRHPSGYSMGGRIALERFSMAPQLPPSGHRFGRLGLAGERERATTARRATEQWAHIVRVRSVERPHRRMGLAACLRRPHHGRREEEFDRRSR